MPHPIHLAVNFCSHQIIINIYTTTYKRNSARRKQFFAALIVILQIPFFLEIDIFFSSQRYKIFGKIPPICVRGERFGGVIFYNNLLQIRRESGRPVGGRGRLQTVGCQLGKCSFEIEVGAAFYITINTKKCVIATPWTRHRGIHRSRIRRRAKSIIFRHIARRISDAAMLVLTLRK